MNAAQRIESTPEEDREDAAIEGAIEAGYEAGSTGRGRNPYPRNSKLARVWCDAKEQARQAARECRELGV